MKKYQFSILLMGSVISLSAQVGINTNSPQATLDVVGMASDVEKLDGIIAPRITGAQLRAKTYTSSQDGAIVYVTTADSSPSGQTVDVTSVGYYYYNGTSAINKWIKISTGNSSVGLEPWNIQNTSTEAYSNTQNIFQNGKVGIGFTSSDAVSTKQLDVNGDFRSLYSKDGYHYGIENDYSAYGTPINTLYVSNNKDLTTATEVAALSVIPNQTALSAYNAAGNSSIATFASSAGGDFGMVANSNSTNVSSQIWGYNNTASNVTLSNAKNSAEASQVVIEKLKGVNFNFKKADYSVEGNYTFPRNNGTANQVLITDGSASAAQLSWKNPSDLFSQTNDWHISGNTDAEISTTTETLGSVVASTNYLGTKGAADNLVVTVAGNTRAVLDTTGTLKGGGTDGDSYFMWGNQNTASKLSTTGMTFNNAIIAGYKNTLTNSNIIPSTGASATVLLGKENTITYNGVAIGYNNSVSSGLVLGNNNTNSGGIIIGAGNTSNSGQNVFGNSFKASLYTGISTGTNIYSNIYQYFAVNDAAGTAIQQTKIGVNVIPVTTQESDIKVSKSVQFVANGASSTTCNSTNEGSIRYTTTTSGIVYGIFEGCRRTNSAGTTFSWTSLN